MPEKKPCCPNCGKRLHSLKGKWYCVPCRKYRRPVWYSY
jgi:hypothetical protein